jgi:hypothetical protein
MYGEYEYIILYPKDRRELDKAKSDDADVVQSSPEGSDEDISLAEDRTGPRLVDHQHRSPYRDGFS